MENFCFLLLTSKTNSLNFNTSEVDPNHSNVSLHFKQSYHYGLIGQTSFFFPFFRSLRPEIQQNYTYLDRQVKLKNCIYFLLIFFNFLISLRQGFRSSEKSLQYQEHEFVSIGYLNTLQIIHSFILGKSPIQGILSFDKTK